MHAEWTHATWNWRSNTPAVSLLFELEFDRDGRSALGHSPPRHPSRFTLAWNWRSNAPENVPVASVPRDLGFDGTVGRSGFRQPSRRQLARFTLTWKATMSPALDPSWSCSSCAWTIGTAAVSSLRARSRSMATSETASSFIAEPVTPASYDPVWTMRMGLKNSSENSVILVFFWDYLGNPLLQFLRCFSMYNCTCISLIQGKFGNEL